MSLESFRIIKNIKLPLLLNTNNFLCEFSKIVKITKTSAELRRFWIECRWQVMYVGQSTMLNMHIFRHPFPGYFYISHCYNRYNGSVTKYSSQNYYLPTYMIGSHYMLSLPQQCNKRLYKYIPLVMFIFS